MRTCERAAPDRGRRRASRSGEAARTPQSAGAPRHDRPARGCRHCGPRRAAGARRARPVSPAGHDDEARGRDRRPARDLPRSRDDPDLVRAPGVVRALGEDLRRVAGGLHAPRARAPALDRRACRNRRSRLADDRRRRLARANRPLRRSGDAHRGDHDPAHGGRRDLGQRACRPAGAGRRAAALLQHALVPEAGACRLPLGARLVRNPGGHCQRDGRGRAHGRRPQPAGEARQAD